MPADARRGGTFRLGVNYWPARSAMGWWQRFDPAELAADLSRIGQSGCDSVRIFLTWEDFQPSASRVDTKCVDHLVTTLDIARGLGLAVMPTLFTGHMSGVNWIPPWALGDAAGDARFRVVSGGRVVASRLASWYTDPAITRAQESLARELAGALAGHEALWAWDLGNENSNCVVAPDKHSSRDWLSRMTDSLREGDPHALVTVGLHMEDLEQDRNLGPREAAEFCDFLTMHGYPGYASWTSGPTDERLPPFLARVTVWLSGGAEVLFSEFGVPTCPIGTVGGDTQLVDEESAAAYIDRCLDGLLACGSTGAMLWCHSDYAEALWTLPPLDLARHERSFGLWRADGSPKPSVARVEAFARRRADPPAVSPVSDSAWIDMDPAEFYRAPGTELPRLYRRYCEALTAGA